MGLLFKNNAETTLSSGINNSTTTVPVTSAAVFPTPNANNVFFATIEEGNTIEVVKVTGISSNDLTVVRAQDNTSAAAFGSGAKIELRLTAKILEMGTSSLTDLDGDTKIEVEATADSDTIALTSNSGDFSFINSSNTIAFIKTDNNDFTIQNNLNDKDVIFKGYDSDGGGLLEALRIDYSENGNIGIGTSSPASKLHIKVGTNNNLEIQETGGDLRLLAINDARDANVPMEFAASQYDFLTGKIQVGDSAVANLQLGNNGDVIEIKAKKDGTDDIDLAFHTQASGGTTAERMRITEGGDVGIGTTSPAAELHINDTGGLSRIRLEGSASAADNFEFGQGTTGVTNGGFEIRDVDAATTRFVIDSSGNVGIGNTSPSVALGVTGAIIASDNITAYGTPSDIRLKENIVVIDNALDKVKQLKGITYDLKSDGNRLTGLIAQDLEKVLPEAVYETSAVDDANDKHLAIRYGNTVGLLVEAIKEQQEQIETLTARVKELEDK